MANRSQYQSQHQSQHYLAVAFGDQCRRWAIELGASPASAKAAREAGQRLSELVSQGHACLPLNTPTLGFELPALVSSGVAGPPGSGKPLVLDGQERLYLARYFDAEYRLAQALLARHQNVPAPPGAAAHAMLRALFPPERDGEVNWQQVAVALALCRRLTVISGGPGTGKTTTVARLLACLLADQPECRIGLAAPTGKAAARLQETLVARAKDLPEEVARYLPQRASTLHSLLGLGVDGSAPRHHRENPLPLDVLVVDEASMLDLTLSMHLVEALPLGARLILLGDKEQLKAVEAGSVFAALSGNACLSPDTCVQLAALTGWSASALQREGALSPLADGVVWLTHSHRFSGSSALGQLASALADGDGDAALNYLSRGEGEIALHPGTGAGLDGEALEILKQAYTPYREALEGWQAGQRDAAAVFAAFDQFRVLCAIRQGPRGVANLNNQLESAVLGHSRIRGLRFGLPIIISRNDPSSGLFNGDIGIVLTEGAEPGVYFPGLDGQYRVLHPGRLPAYETAFALTVHKAQGSEFERVALVLPDQDSPLLTRELIYTAVTRARQGVNILSQPELLRLGILRQIPREGGLEARFREGLEETK